MKKTFMCVTLVVLIALGVGFTAFNLQVFTTNIKHTGYLVISVLGGLESLMTAIALVLLLKSKKGKWVNIIYVVAEVMCLPTVFLFIIWIGINCISLLS